MEDDYSKSRFQKGSTGDEMFMHYHQADYLTVALEDNGFNILQLMRQEFDGPVGDMNRDLILIAQI